jgi:hypothetical protein
LDSLQDVVSELRMLRRRTFGELDDSSLQSRLPGLAAAARRVHEVAEDRPAPLRKLLTSAASRVVPEDLQPAVTDLFGLSRDTFGKVLAYRQETAAGRFTPRPAPSTFRQAPQYTPRLVEALGVAILDLLSGVTLDELQKRATAELIERTDLVDAGADLLGGEARTLWIWGEAGTGKTVLADRVAERLAPRHPVVRIRLGNSRVMRQDLVRAVDDTSADEAARLVLLRRMMAANSVGLVILDDAEGPAQVAALELSGTAVPVLVTSRVLNPDDGIATLHVGNLSDDQAQQAIKALLPTLGPEDAARLARLAGGRPLAINHIAAYLRTLGTASHVVLDGLETDLAQTLQAIESISDRSLTAVYRRMIDDWAAGHAHVVAVLDTLLWITDQGLVNLPLAREFLAGRFTRPVGAVQISAAGV